MIFLLPLSGTGQNLTFSQKSPLLLKEFKYDYTVPLVLSFSELKDRKEVKVSVDEPNSSAEKGKDYDFTAASLHFEAGKDSQAQFELVIKTDDFEEKSEQVVFKFTYTDDASVTQEIAYKVIIGSSDGNSRVHLSDSSYTPAEKKALQAISMNIHAGGNLDFNNIKFNDFCGELMILANDVLENRFGLILGISNYNALSVDSLGDENLRYLRSMLIDSTSGGRTYTFEKYSRQYRKSSNQWNFYFGHTIRLNPNLSQLFNCYLNLRGEAIKTTITTDLAYNFDSLEVTTTPRSAYTRLPFTNSSQSQSYISYSVGIGIPMILNAKDKLSLYFEPSAGWAWTLAQTATKPPMSRGLASLVKMKATELATGLNISVGGEFRISPGFRPTLISYIATNINFGKWFKG